MLPRQTYEQRCLMPGIYEIPCRVFPNGAGVPTFDGLGIASVTHVSAGLFEVTFQDPWLGFAGTPISLCKAAASALWVEWATAYNPTTKKRQFRLFNATAVLTDLAADPANIVEFHVLGRRSTAKGG